MTKKKHEGTQQAQPVQQAQLRKDEGASGQGKGGELSPDRLATHLRAIDEMQGEVPVFPGRLAQRVRHLIGLQRAAERDQADLVKTPFHDEPALSRDEIAAMREQIEVLRLTGSVASQARASEGKEAAAFRALAEQARGDMALVLKALDVRYRNHDEGKQRLVAIRAGSGDADTLQDVTDVLLEAEHEAAFLARCPRGEAAAVDRLKKLSPELTKAMGEKMLATGAAAARLRRDRAFALVTRTERRLRAAADYWYHGTDKAADYATFAAPSSSTDTPAPAPSPSAPSPK